MFCRIHQTYDYARVPWKEKGGWKLSIAGDGVQCVIVEDGIFNQQVSLAVNLDMDQQKLLQETHSTDKVKNYLLCYISMQNWHS